MTRATQRVRQQAGVSMIEVLVAMVILLVGLLGLAGLMVQSQRSEMESYQRVQALVLLQDMYARINANRNVAACYAFTTNASAGTPFVGAAGTGAASLPLSCALGTTEQQNQFVADMNAWNQLQLGSSETLGGNNAGAMIGARGCVSYDPTTELNALDPLTWLPAGTTISGTGIYTVTVAWQGMGDSAAPTGVNCAKNLYGTEAQRRVVSLTFRIAALK